MLKLSRAQFYTQVEIRAETFNKVFSRLRNEGANSNVNGNFGLLEFAAVLCITNNILLGNCISRSVSSPLAPEVRISESIGW